MTHKQKFQVGPEGSWCLEMKFTYFVAKLTHLDGHFGKFSDWDMFGRQSIICIGLFRIFFKKNFGGHESFSWGH